MTLLKPRPRVYGSGIAGDPTIVDGTRLKALGAINGREYVEHDGQEYILAGGTVARADFARADTAARYDISSTDEDGRHIAETVYRRLIPMAKGTYQAAAAKAERVTGGLRRKAEHARVLRPVDGLGALPALGPVADRIVPFGPADTGLPAGWREMILHGEGAEADPPYGLPGAVLSRGHAAAHGPEAIIARLQKRGVRLSLSPTKEFLIVEAPGGRLFDAEREAVDKAARLLLAHLTGSPLGCALGHKGEAPPAASIALGGAPICEAHLRGDA
jgi:hypothetical protein